MKVAASLSRTPLLLAALALLAWPGARAQGLTVLESANFSYPDFSVHRVDLAAEFTSRLQVSEPVTDGLGSAVDLRFSWLLATTHAMGVPLPGPMSLELGWGLTLRVDDPLEQGYALDVDTRMRGITAALASAAGHAFSELTSLRFGVFEAPASTPTLLPGLSTGSHGVTSSGQLDRVDVAGGGGVRVGSYRGTRDFFFFLQDTALTMAASSGDAEASIAWQQFGRAAEGPSLAFANPLQTDPDLQDLGHFFRVTATFAAPVPEPGPWALLAAGLGVLWLRRRGGPG